MLSNLISKISDYIKCNKLLIKGSKYIVALSGGADSVALLMVLKELGYDIEAAHCNFNLRGNESDRDEDFCKKLCLKCGINLHITHFDTHSYAQLHKVSIEMAARELRYSYFEALRKDINAVGVCVAHHRDDSVETIIMNLIRGTGLAGLTGISPRNGNILRPLLCVSRNDILDYLATIKQDYVTDSSNLVDDVTRNKIRIDIIPLIESINPSAKTNIAKTANYLRDVAKITDKAMEYAIKNIVTEYDNCISVSIEKLKTEVSIGYTLYYILRDYGFSSAQTLQISEQLDVDSGREWSSQTHTALINRGNILIAPTNKTIYKSLQIPECGTYIYCETVKFKFEKGTVNSDFTIDKSKSYAFFDESKISFPLTIRHVEVGDKFVPFGMKGFKLLSDYTTDIKMSVFDKRKQLVVTDACGNIIWLVNQRSDNRFRINNDTKRYVCISFIPNI